MPSGVGGVGRGGKVGGKVGGKWETGGGQCGAQREASQGALTSLVFYYYIIIIYYFSGWPVRVEW